MKLKLFRVNEGGQFTGDDKLEVDFEKSRKVALTGESQEGKTTGLECFKIILGAIGGEKIIKDLVNRDSGKFDVEQTFVGNDKKTYFVRATKSQFYVREEGGKVDIGEPKTFIEAHLGKVATDPMKYKNAPIEQFIKWNASFTDMGEEGFEKEYNKQKEISKKSEETRATARKEAKARLVLLADAGYATDKGDLVEAKWVSAEKRYAKQLDVKALSSKLTAAKNKSDKYLENEAKVKGQKEKREQIEAQIKLLLTELDTVNGNIQIGEDWLAKNADVKKEYDAVKKEYDNAAQFAVEYEAFQTMLRHRTEMYEYEKIAERADAAAQAAENKKKELMWQVIPDIRGAELVLESTPEKPADFYVDGFNRRQQSATQYLTAIVKILDKIGCRILILDDVATYGSEFRKLLEQLSKKGWYILYSLLKIDQELEIEYN